MLRDRYQEGISLESSHGAVGSGRVFADLCGYDNFSPLKAIITVLDLVLVLSGATFMSRKDL